MRQTTILLNSLLMVALFLGNATAEARPVAPDVVDIVIYVGAG